MSVHVIFGAGSAGRATMQALQLQGCRVKMISRSIKPGLPSSVDQVAGDATDVEFVKSVTQDAAVVYQTLGAPYHRWKEELFPMQKSLVEGIRGRNIPLVALENLYLYGDTLGKPMTEFSTLQAQTRKGKVRLAMAQQLQTAHAKGDIQVAQVRAADFIGPGVTQSVIGENFFQSRTKGRTTWVLGEPDQLHTFSYIPDLGKTMVRVGQKEEFFGHTWHVPSPAPKSVGELVHRFAEELGEQPKLAATPAWLLKIMGIFQPELGELPEMLYQWKQPFIMEHSHSSENLGITPTPWQEIISEMLASWRQKMLTIKS